MPIIPAIGRLCGATQLQSQHMEAVEAGGPSGTPLAIQSVWDQTQVQKTVSINKTSKKRQMKKSKIYLAAISYNGT